MAREEAQMHVRQLTGHQADAHHQHKLGKNKYMYILLSHFQLQFVINDSILILALSKMKNEMKTDHNIFTFRSRTSISL